MDYRTIQEKCKDKTFIEMVSAFEDTTSVDLREYLIHTKAEVASEVSKMTKDDINNFLANIGVA